MEQDEQMMREALKEARAAREEGEVPIGAVVACKGRIIAKGHIMTERLYLQDCTIYVSVEPCPMCAAALAWAQIGTIVYGADDPKRGYSQFTPSLLHPKTEVRKGVIAQECSEIVTDFFAPKRKV